MKTTKAVVSVHLRSVLAKPSMEEEEEKIERPGKPSEGACVEQVKLSEWEHPLAPTTGCSITLLESVDDAQTALEIFPCAEFDFSLVSGEG